MGLTAVPDWHETIEDTIAEGDEYEFFFPIQRSTKVNSEGLTSKGKEIDSETVYIYHIFNDKHAEYWNSTGKLVRLVLQTNWCYSNHIKKEKETNSFYFFPLFSISKH
jgi:predicted ester cyclase